MKNTIIITCILMTISALCFAQSEDELSVKNNFWMGPQVYDGNTLLDHDNILQTLSDSPYALSLYKKSKTQKSQGSVLTLLGGVSAGYGARSLSDYGDDEGLAFLGVGIAAAIGGGLIMSSANDNLRLAIAEYNHDQMIGYDNLPSPSYSVSMITTNTGIGIGITF